VICFLLMGVIYCTVFHSKPYFKTKLIKNKKKKKYLRKYDERQHLRRILIAKNPMKNHQYEDREREST